MDRTLLQVLLDRDHSFGFDSDENEEMKIVETSAATVERATSISADVIIQYYSSYHCGQKTNWKIEIVEYEWWLIASCASRTMYSSAENILLGDIGRGDDNRKSVYCG